MEKEGKMRKTLILFLAFAVVAVLVGVTSHYAIAKKIKDCLTIPGGGIFTSTGEEINPGYDEWGYNYQALIFNGPYCYYDRQYTPGEPYCDVSLQMKWNDAWLSNKDCDGDGLLDRHYGYESYVGSEAWLTNHMWGSYTDEDGKVCHWTYFVKIIAVPADAIKEEGIWYAADGTEIGPSIWGSFAEIQWIENDPCAGIHGAQYISPVGPGFGKW